MSDPTKEEEKDEEADDRSSSPGVGVSPRPTMVGG